MNFLTQKYEHHRVIDGWYDSGKAMITVIIRALSLHPAYGRIDFSFSWEPPTSFSQGTDHPMITQFWERVGTGGRDIKDISLFKTGEEFFPVGPPRTCHKHDHHLPVLIISDREI